MKQTLCAILLAVTCGCSGGNAEELRLSPVVQSSQKKPLKKFPFKKTLDFLTREGLQYKFDVKCYHNGVVVVDPQQVLIGQLRFYEAGEVNNYWSVEPGDFFVATDISDEFTHVIKYVTIDPSTQDVAFDDLATGLFSVQYDRRTRTGVLPVGHHFCGFHVEHDRPYRLSIDQNGDGLFDCAQSLIVKQDGSRISEEDLTE